jgi:indole-3-glycerol phosphate synthase
VTVAERPAARNVVAEIAARRRKDVRAELAATGRRALDDAVTGAPTPRPIAERLAAPGLHLIAEIKRASPSAGRIAGANDDIVARVRA